MRQPRRPYFGGAHRLHGRYFCRANPNAISIFDLAKKRQPSRWYMPPVRVTKTFLFMSAAGGLATDFSSGGPHTSHTPHTPHAVYLPSTRCNVSACLNEGEYSEFST